MKLALRRRSKAERAIDATGDLAKLWAGAKLTKGTARAGRKSARLKTVGGSKTGRRAAVGKAVARSPSRRGAGRKALETALAGKAVKGAAKRRGGRGRGRKLLVLGAAAGAVAIVLKARKGGSDQPEPAWTPPDVPVGGATVAGGTTAPGTVTPSPTGGAPTDAADPATLREDAPNAGATGWPPKAAHEQAGR
jgi:hypothetical protein